MADFDFHRDVAGAGANVVRLVLNPLTTQEVHFTLDRRLTTCRGFLIVLALKFVLPNGVPRLECPSLVFLALDNFHSSSPLLLRVG